MDINAKVAIVTGAAAGIGRAYAFALADAGAAAVALADIDAAGLTETAAGVEERGAKPLSVQVDVTDPGELESLFANVEEQFGGIDIVFNNAGMMCGDPQWPATSLARIQQVVSVNLLGVMFGTRLALDAMARRGGGVVINTASVAAFSPMANDPIYSSTKAAVVNFTQSCAPLAESSNVRVNAVLPGVTQTAILAKSGDGETPAQWLAPMLEIVAKLEPRDIAAAALQLITDDAHVGACVVVNNPAAAGEAHAVDILNDSAAFHDYALGRRPSQRAQ
jgi:NAD(P)-dependent dehydrogenase (short-subunit alcohol dehydrogenase family)